MDYFIHNNEASQHDISNDCIIYGDPEYSETGHSHTVFVPDNSVNSPLENGRYYKHKSSWFSFIGCHTLEFSRLENPNEVKHEVLPDNQWFTAEILVAIVTVCIVFKIFSMI